MKGCVATVRRQTLHPNLTCCGLFMPHLTSSSSSSSSSQFACEESGQGSRRTLCKPTLCKPTLCKPTLCKPTLCKPTLCKPILSVSALHYANRFCRLSDLLSNRTMCFGKLITWIFWCSFCSRYLVQLATPCCPAASPFCMMCIFAEPLNSLPKNGHEFDYIDLQKHCIYH
jgi:hypothetical protein